MVLFYSLLLPFSHPEMPAFVSSASFPSPRLPVHHMTPARRAPVLSRVDTRYKRDQIHIHTHNMYSILQEKLAAMARVQVRKRRNCVLPLLFSFYGHGLAHALFSFIRTTYSRQRRV